jgi:hypothetical protein
LGVITAWILAAQSLIRVPGRKTVERESDERLVAAGRGEQEKDALLAESALESGAIVAHLAAPLSASVGGHCAFLALGRSELPGS